MSVESGRIAPERSERGRESSRLRFQVSGFRCDFSLIGIEKSHWSFRPAQASLFSADAHTLGFYGTFEGRVHFGIIPQPRRNNLLEESRDKLGLVRVLSTFAVYRSSGDKLTLGESVCTTRIGGP